MSTAEITGDSQRRAFLAKLSAFRRSLDGAEQEMLDALVVAAREAYARNDLQTYWFTAPGAPSLPRRFP